MGTKIQRRRSVVTLATAYADQSETGDELVIPSAEELAALDAEALSALAERAQTEFDAIYGDGSGLTDEQLAALASLTEGIQLIETEAGNRAAAQEARDAQAAELAARVRPAAAEGEAPADADETPAEGEAPADADETPAEGEAPAEEALVASGPRRIALSSVRRTPTPEPRNETPADAEPGIRDYMVASGEGLGFAVNAPIDFSEAGQMLDARLRTFNAKHYEGAQRNGVHIREQHSLLQINRPIPADLQITSTDPEHVRQVFERATDESRLPGGSLVASGTGWCAPSTPIFDLIGEDESRDGLLDVPEIGVPRGGVSFTTGPDFRDLFSEITGFSFTEEQDVAGEYAPGANGGANVVGDKPCYHVECPPFEEYRLDVDGLCITAGLLQSRGFPEIIARTVRGALVAHAHRLNGKQIAQMAAGSTAVTLPATQAGTAAPVLTAIELQVEHYRYSRRLARTTTLEAVFPYWIRGAIRSDLARRQGVDMISVPDARIDGWFRERGIAPQFVYNWQAIDTTAIASFTAWPTTVSFLLYSAGTWVKGAADVITVESLYDSVLLGQNNYTALFTEEGWFVAKRGQDSRLVTTSLTADGVVAAAQDIQHNGVLAPAA